MQLIEVFEWEGADRKTKNKNKNTFRQKQNLKWKSEYKLLAA